MTLETTISGQDNTAPTPVDANVYRQLIQQFYETSISQYGADSEQSHMLKMHLVAHTAQD